MGFFPAHIRMLQNEGHTVELACNLNDPLPKKVSELDCSAHHIPFSRSPFSADNIRAYQELKKLLVNRHYDIIHTHTPNASAIVRFACRTLRKQGVQVFYTAHGFHFYDGAPLKNWLLFYPVEKFLSRWTDVLITINREDYQRAQGKFHAKKTVYIPGVGLDTERFKFEYSEDERTKKRLELGVPKDAVMLVSVGELNRNKNHNVVIRAIAELRNPSIHYCIAGIGPLYQELTQISADLKITRQIHLLGYRDDVSEIYHAADICCFPSIREGLGLAALEGMACGLPVVASDNRGTRDYLVNGATGLLCNPNDVDGFAHAIKALIDNPEQREQMVRYNQRAVDTFSTEKILYALQNVYGLIHNHNMGN